MSTRLFFEFPDDEMVSDICPNEGALELFLRETTRALNDIRAKRELILLYDPNSAKAFADYMETMLPAVYPSHSRRLYRLLDGRQSRSPEAEFATNRNASYYVWKNGEIIADFPDFFRNAAESTLNQSEEDKTIVYSPQDRYRDRKWLIMVKDARNRDNLPVFCRLYFISDLDSLDLLLFQETSFSLLDLLRFRRDNRIQQGQRVFQEIATDYFWYLDNFHKTHYEVFDRQGYHLGEADLQGQLDRNKADPRKKLD